jgi:hypothetical protein
MFNPIIDRQSRFAQQTANPPTPTGSGFTPPTIAALCPMVTGQSSNQSRGSADACPVLHR